MPSTSDPSTIFPTEPTWEGDGTHRIPFLAYTDEAIYQRELERFFYKSHWCYVGLEAEVASLTAASFPALPHRSTATAAAVSYSVAPTRSFMDIAREAHERTEAAKRAAEQRALAEREQAARDARDLALRQSFHDARSRPVYRGGAGAGAAEPVDESYNEPAAGGYNSSSYYAEEDGEEEKDVEEEEDDEEEAIEEAILDAADDLLRLGDGDILVFLPGEREIRDTAEHLRKYQGRSAKLKHIEVLPLFARLSIEDQQKIFKSHSSRRIVLATNVAETSLTVPGIKYVIDAGLARVNRYSTRAKVEQLQIIIHKASVR